MTILDHITKDAFGWMLLCIAFATGFYLGWRAYRQCKGTADDLEEQAFGDASLYGREKQ